ncbi:MAG: phosphodiester glycosidase family protein [Thermodesulfobacteriota bacterium]
MHQKVVGSRQSRATPAGEIPDASGEKAGTRAPVSARPNEVKLPEDGGFDFLSLDPLDLLALDNIKPLYTSPRLQDEGVWSCTNSPRDSQGRPLTYQTFYRPSVEFPNAIVFMMVVDMRKVFMKYYVGSGEPGAAQAVNDVEPVLRPRLLAITNAMWMQRHSKDAGSIFRGKMIYPMTDGVASLIVYKDGTVDVREWGRDVRKDRVEDARQLLHLIVKDGAVVNTVVQNGKVKDAEIGLGFLLGGGGRDQDGKHFWYVAHRSGFGVRKDGNIVFAVGHHIGTKDLAKALALAGCERAMHADANPHNIVGNLYLKDAYGNLLRKAMLSPEQPNASIKRYEDGYSKDFFGYFTKSAQAPSGTGAAAKKSPKSANRR